MCCLFSQYLLSTPLRVPLSARCFGEEKNEQSSYTLATILNIHIILFIIMIVAAAAVVIQGYVLLSTYAITEFHQALLMQW